MRVGKLAVTGHCCIRAARTASSAWRTGSDVSCARLSVRLFSERGQGSGCGHLPWLPTTALGKSWSVRTASSSSWYFRVATVGNMFRLHPRARFPALPASDGLRSKTTPTHFRHCGCRAPTTAPRIRRSWSTRKSLRRSWSGPCLRRTRR